MPNQDEQKLEQVLPGEVALGSTFASKYRVLSLLGAGGMSSVYQAQHLLLGKIVALKLMHPKYSTDPTALIRFKTEAAAVNSLSHPNIITVFDCDVFEGRPYQAMEYLQGLSLMDTIKGTSGLPAQQAVPIFKQIAAALHHAHQKGIIHRDLKPSNVMLIQQDQNVDHVKLVDFGIAKVLPQEGQPIQHLTQTGEIFGSPYYMSPEQCLGRQLDARSDIYSMGCLMYETLTGAPPFAGETVFETVQKHIDETPRSVKDKIAEPNLAQRLDYILLRTLAKDANDRYQTMAELADALAEIETHSLITRLGDKLDAWRLRIAQLFRKRSARIVAALVALTLLSGGITVAAISSVFGSKLPSFQMAPWPLYLLEVEPSAAAELNILESAMPQIAQDVRTLTIQDPAGRLKRLKALAEMQSRNGLFDSAAAYAGELRTLAQSLGLKNLDAVGTDERARRFQGYVVVGDACYYAQPTKENTNLAIWYYSSATNQLYDAVRRARERICMKLADLYIRQKNWKAADVELKSASNADGKESSFWTGTFKLRSSLQGIPDRALYLTRIGEVSVELGNLPQAELAYTTACDEWDKLPNSKLLSGQCRFLLGSVQEKQNKLAEAERNFRKAVNNYSADNQNASAVLGSLANVYKKQGNWWQWLQTELEAHQKARDIRT